MSARPKSDKATIIGGLVSVAALLVALFAWIHPFSPESTGTEPADAPVVVTTTPQATPPTTTRAPTTHAPASRAPARDEANADLLTTPTDCSTIGDFLDRTECQNRVNNDAAQDVIDNFE